MWDLLVRVFHWSLALFFLLAYFLEGAGLKLHSHVGYTVALLVLFRIVWGVIGSESARFANFVVWPWQSIRYVLRLAQGQASYYRGHNPAGAAMVVVLLAMLLLTALSGIALYALQGSGPLANTSVVSWPGGLLADVHEYSADLSLLLIVMHVAGVLFSSYIYRENLTWSMFTGYKNKQKSNQEGERS
ncbi:MAG: cytochrome b/b6 domain-containing protein [Gammaproteobacteria bacterium]|nr:cytochrome b/b6 domain-containing protein [Gammaproteobacteria bacterium]MDP6733556.1 cytochrome b/b6 domain-containing protein [Gammaproteobacteria bacterium]